MLRNRRCEERTKLIAAILALCIAFALPAWGQKAADVRAVQPWEDFDFRHQILPADRIADLSLIQLKYLRGLVFGRHGRVFGEETIQDYLKTRPWYKPDPNYRVSVLNANERASMDVIKETEFKKHAIPEAGDMKFFRNRLLDDTQIKAIKKRSTPLELMIMRSEIEAIHGKRFEAQPWLQQFFEQRYWYKPVSNYNDSQLNEFERKNLEALIRLQNEKRNVKLSPGDMGQFQETLITPDLLASLNLYDLRLLRNEVYARRGKRFHLKWLQQYFSEVEWYHPFPDYRNPQLNSIEIKNLALIVKQEHRLHEEVSTKPLAKAQVEGLFLEDVRKLRFEIMARHGKVFKDPWFNSYFKSLAWYKPDPNYSDRNLSPIERQNIALLLKTEKEMTHEANAAPA